MAPIFAAMVGALGATLCRGATYSTMVVLNSFEANHIGHSSTLGLAKVTLDTTSGQLMVESEFLKRGNITASHIHTGAVGSSGGVLVALNAAVKGSFSITSAAASSMLNGTTYLNVHTALFPAGELRGQVLFAHSGIAVLLGQQQSSSVASSASGIGSVQIDDTAGTVTVSALSFTGLQNATAIHIHGPAAAGANANVKCPIASGAAGTISTSYSSFQCPGTWNSSELEGLRSGKYYFNVHTSQNPSGAIRGQIFFPSRLTSAPCFADLSPSMNTMSSGTGSYYAFRTSGTDSVNGGTILTFLSVKGLSSAQIDSRLFASASPAYQIQMPSTFGSTAFFPVTVTGPQVADIMAGRTYINVNTTMNSPELSGPLMTMEMTSTRASLAVFGSQPARGLVALLAALVSAV